MTGNSIGRDINTDALYVFGGTPAPDQPGGRVELYGVDHNLYPGVAVLKAKNNNSWSQLTMRPDAEPLYIINDTSKTLAMQEDVIPRSGGAVMTGSTLGRTVNDNELRLDGGTDWNNGASISLRGNKERSACGAVILYASDGSDNHWMCLQPNGTWTWNGTAVQLISDQRLKQQITEIDNALLDAWEDVELVQFKYNDAVDQKGDTARLHTGYVVQQIDEACKSHNLDISKYGLYCHEEYPERTEEVTTENEDGTTSKETKVIEPAREHYSLRYTETLVVECAYLRREVSRLKQQNEDLEQRLKMLENK